MKNGKKIEDLMFQRLDRFEEKLDRLMEEIVPAIQTTIAVVKAEAITEANTTSKFHGIVWGTIATIISVVGVAVAYFKG